MRYIFIHMLEKYEGRRPVVTVG